MNPERTGSMTTWITCPRWRVAFVDEPKDSESSPDAVARFSRRKFLAGAAAALAMGASASSTPSSFHPQSLMLSIDRPQFELNKSIKFDTVAGFVRPMRIWLRDNGTKGRITLTILFQGPENESRRIESTLSLRDAEDGALAVDRKVLSDGRIAARQVLAAPQLPGMMPSRASYHVVAVDPARLRQAVGVDVRLTDV